MTQKRTGRRASGRQANIVGTASSSAAGFGGLSGVAGNTGVALTKTTSPVSPAGLSTVGGRLQVSGSTKVATPVVVGGGSSGSGSSSGGSMGKLPVKEISGGTKNPTGGSSSGSGSTGGSVITKPVVTQPTTPTTVVPKPTTPTGGSSSGGSSSGISPVKKTVEELPGAPNPNPTGNGSSGSGSSSIPGVAVKPVEIPRAPANPTIVVPSPTIPTGAGNEDKEKVTAPAGFGDRFVLNPAVEEKIEFNEDVEEMKTNEIVTTPGFGGIEGLVNRPELEYPQDPLPGEVGVEAQKDPVDDNPEVPTTETLAKSGSGKKWLWLIVAAVALWFVFKKK